MLAIGSNRVPGNRIHGKRLMQIATATVGYPRIGKQRELKKALEAYWHGMIRERELRESACAIEAANWQAQADAGIDRIGVGDTSFYDPVLDWTVWLGLIPDRFRELSGLERYFAMARGQDPIAPLEMTKWFDTNYHYLVPEIDARTVPDPDFEPFLATVRRAQAQIGERAVPIVLGPMTLLQLSQLEADLDAVLEQLLPAYEQLLQQLQAMGIRQVQLHEPALVRSDASQYRRQYQRTYQRLAAIAPPIYLATYFDDLGDAYPWVVQLPVSGIGLDLTRGDNWRLIQRYGWPQDKKLGAGLADARNIWRLREGAVREQLDALQQAAPQLVLQPSASLQFVPYDARLEQHLPEPLRGVLSFAEQKLDEVVLLARTAAGEETDAEWQSLERAWQAFAQFSPANERVRSELDGLSERDFQRELPYEERRQHQRSLPLFPTTTIGSFPQTDAVRQLRARYRRGEISLAEYRNQIDAHIGYCIGVQDGMGLDVLVHGEAERSDMVEYFGQQLEGFAFTQHGWVQSFGSRCVRPPILYGDVSRPQPMTVREFQVAQSLTDKPVKGMLTGPVTLLNWSYPRSDLSRQAQAFQLALAVRDEVADLEAAGARIVQVDEAAMREGLPLKQARQEAYLDWAVRAFRLSTAVARPATQIHTHMCYSEFGDIMEALKALDADAISIENSRSDRATLVQLAQAGYPRPVGPGVYDIHAPIVPDVEAMRAQLDACQRYLPAEQIWVNPDCGLKTRRWPEVKPALRNMVAAAQTVRETYQQSALRGKA